MTIADLIAQLQLKVLSGGPDNRDITDAYVSDLLSDVMANSTEGSVWITLQTHMNIVAVATMKNLAAILLVNGRTPEQDTLTKAEQEGIMILGTDATAFMTAGKIYQLLHS